MDCPVYEGVLAEAEGGCALAGGGKVFGVLTNDEVPRARHRAPQAHLGRTIETCGGDALRTRARRVAGEAETHRTTGGDLLGLIPQGWRVRRLATDFLQSTCICYLNALKSNWQVQHGSLQPRDFH